jgi:glycosyltransferase involved in cell wall biosynthesis
MDNTPFFSIIIPTYNRAHLIRRPIDSVIAQTYTNWELIIVDDGSTDDTKAIVESYHDDRIRYIWQENQKESIARNLGILISKGTWICFQDSDDEYLSNHLEVLYKEIMNSDSYKIIRTGLLLYEDGIQIGKSSYNVFKKYDPYPYECFTTAAIHYSVLKDIKFSPYVFINEDLHFLIRIGMKYEIKVLPEWTGIYYRDPKSSGGIGAKYQQNLLNRRICLDDILSWDQKLIIPFIKRYRCLTEILLIIGHVKFNPTLLMSGIFSNLSVFIRFPWEYLKLLFRIFIVKFGDMSKLYKTQDRF